jgi:hypothetical protein
MQIALQYDAPGLLRPRNQDWCIPRHAHIHEQTADQTGWTLHTLFQLRHYGATKYTTVWMCITVKPDRVYREHYYPCAHCWAAFCDNPETNLMAHPLGRGFPHTNSRGRLMFKRLYWEGYLRWTEHRDIWGGND